MLRPAACERGEARQWACWYASVGLPLVPVCWPREDTRCAWHTRQYLDDPSAEGVVRCHCGKTPLQAAYMTEPLRTVAEVEALWRRHPLAGPAVPLWAANLVRADLDGPMALLTAYQRGLPEPCLLVATTRATGGWHLYWHRQPGVPLATCMEVLSDGSRIEISSEQVAPLPPTIRPGVAPLTRTERPSGWGWLQWTGPALGEAAVPVDNRDATNAMRVLPMFGLAPAAPGWAVERLRRAADGKAHKEGPSAEKPAAVAPDRPRRELSARMRALLDIGPAAQAGRYPSGSEAVWALACNMARAGWLLTEAEAALIGSPWVAELVDRRGGVGWLRADVARAFSRALTRPTGNSGRIMLGQ